MMGRFGVHFQRNLLCGKTVVLVLSSLDRGGTLIPVQIKQHSRVHGAFPLFHPVPLTVSNATRLEP